MKGRRADLPSLLEGFLVRRSQKRATSGPGPSWSLLIAAAVLVVGSVWSVSRADLALEELRWLPIVVVVAIGVPATVALNTAEFQYSARLVDVRISVGRSVSVVLAATAANYLPLPGGPLVRVAVLRGRGASVRAATLATGAVGLVWVAVGALVFASLVLVSGGVGLAVFAAIVGACAAVVATEVQRRLSLATQARENLARIVGIEVGSVLVAGLRIYFVLRGLDVGVSPSDAIVIGSAGIVASLVGFAPGGLGVREISAAAAASLVGVMPEHAFLAVAIDRVIGGALTAPWAISRSLRGTWDRSGAPES